MYMIFILKNIHLFVEQGPGKERWNY